MLTSANAFERLGPRGHRVVFTLDHSKNIAQVTDAGSVRIAELFLPNGSAINCIPEGIATRRWSDDDEMLVAIECDPSHLPVVPFDLDEIEDDASTR